jgi:TonB family protein
MPRLVFDPRPNCTSDAVRNKIAGRVVMEIIVEPDGTVGPVRVTQSLDAVYGLDDEAVRTVKKWRFVPGMRDGVAVRVMVRVDMTFSLRHGPRVDPPLTWPVAFLPTDAAARGPWVDATFDINGTALNVTYPQGWKLRKSSRPGQVAEMANETMTLAATILISSGTRIPLSPLSAEQLAERLAAGQRSSVPEGLAWVAIGQIRQGDRLWLWQETYRGSSDGTPRAMTLWTFTTALPAQAISVAFAAEHPPGLDASALWDQQRQAGAVFGELVRRISIVPR